MTTEIQFCRLVEDGIAEGLQNWFKIFINLYADLVESRTKTDLKSDLSDTEFRQIEAALREQRLHTIYTVLFYTDSFFSVASAIIELQKLTRYLRVGKVRCSHLYRLDRLFIVESAKPCEKAVERISPIPV